MKGISNCQLFAILNKFLLGDDTFYQVNSCMQLKALQHELGCMSSLLKIKTSELEVCVLFYFGCTLFVLIYLTDYTLIQLRRKII